MSEYLGLRSHLKANVFEGGRWVDVDSLTTGQTEQQPRPTPAEWDIYEAMMDTPVPFDAEWGYYTDEEAMNIPPAEDNVRAVRYVSRTVPGYENEVGAMGIDHGPATLRYEAVHAHNEFAGNIGTPVETEVFHG